MSSSNANNRQSNSTPSSSSGSTSSIIPTSSVSSSSSSSSSIQRPRTSVTPTQQQVTLAAVTSSGSDKTLKLKETSTLLKFKKRPISSQGDPDNDLNCPICFDIISVAQVTKCGHSFCQTCITKALEHAHRCPKCNTPCNLNKDIFPNFALNQIIEKYKEENHSKKCKLSQTTTTTIIDYINQAQDNLAIEDVDQILEVLSQKKEELKSTNSKITGLLLLDFAKHYKQVKSDELSKLQHELSMINEDVKVIQQEMQLKYDLDSVENEQDVGGENSAKFKVDLQHKKRIINRYFEELSETYTSFHNKDFSELNATTSGANAGELDRTRGVVLERIRETISKITNYTQLKCIASVNYSNDLYSLSSIVSSIDFDRTHEHFAVVGVTKKIKIYDFDTILEGITDIHYPLYEMTHNAKLSCVSWNKYFKSSLCCSDYDGAVTLWDSDVGSLVKTYQEHEKRCWGVDFCTVDPRLIASASDDSKVKLWSTTQDYSATSIDAKSNVCCVAFKPDSKYHILFGTADHNIHYYDLRNNKEAVRIFKGHRKAVSYVKFSDNNEFVSASTDSTLKSWKLNEGQCVKSYTGHVNEKNFVGLEAYNGYVVTGSENNSVCMYYSDLSRPLLQYKFDDGAFLDKVKREETMNDFVSALCWSDQNILLAANSQGIVKVLELC